MIFDAIKITRNSWC